nr:hypothetical protein [uncultured Ruminococcus sp.]
MLRNKNNKEPKNKKSNKRINLSNIEEPNMDMEFSTCSSYDCTGLIPSEVVNQEEYENYDEMYQFLPTDLRDEDDFY